ncbi:recombination protein RecT [Nitrosomonas marina]|uniref:Recombination protein RecT n=1 Tax=Nitrosomonas marina TaxID=917 RepID=A0A1I0E836_9PROT|nr:recombinase RecT [Nitrosomonas marina]SET40467.1 recombination protein RecT [Nitrosomonas marina]
MSTAELKAVATGKVVDKPKNISDLTHFLSNRMGQIKSVISSNLTPEKMCRIALNELRSNPYLAKIAIQNPGSFVNSVIQASHLGLEIGGALGQAYLVPFKGEIKMMPGYRGLISLARRSGEISSINAEIVYENDLFDLELGIDTKVKHKPCLSGDRGEPNLVYMVAHFKDGGSHFEWMTVAEVMKIKARSSAVKSGKETPWDTDRDEMIKKTIIRRGWKYLPMSIEMQSAEKIDTANESGKSVFIEGDGVVIDESSGEIISEKSDDETGNDRQKAEEAKPDPEPEPEPEPKPKPKDEPKAEQKPSTTETQRKPREQKPLDME